MNINEVLFFKAVCFVIYLSNNGVMSNFGLEFEPNSNLLRTMSLIYTTGIFIAIEKSYGMLFEPLSQSRKCF